MMVFALYKLCIRAGKRPRMWSLISSVLLFVGAKIPLFAKVVGSAVRIRIHKIDELLEGINTANTAGRRLIGDRTRIWCGKSGLWRVLERDNNRSVRECNGR